MKSKSLLRLIVLVAGGELFINNITPGTLTIEEIILDVALLLAIICCVCFHRRLHILTQRLPFIDDVLDCVEECCKEEDDKPCTTKEEANQEEGA